jgi:transcription termination factor Rho
LPPARGGITIGEMIRKPPRAGSNMDLKHIAERIAQYADVAPSEVRVVRPEQRAQQKLYRETYRTVRNALDEAADRRLATAQMILDAAAKARGQDAPQFANDETSRRAKMIVNMGRHRRNEPESK